MSDTWRALTALTVLACAASGGAFSTYSGFTTRALDRLPAAQGMAAMQQVNLAAPRSPVFMALVLGPGALLIALAVRALVDRAGSTSGSHPGLVVAGAVVYGVGVVAVTVAFHVPRNDALAALDAATQQDDWHRWLRAWVRGNHVRTASGMAAAVLLALSLR